MKVSSEPHIGVSMDQAVVWADISLKTEQFMQRQVSDHGQEEPLFIEY